MASSKEEVLALVNAFHDCSTGKGTAAQQAAFFLHPEPRIFILHGEDVSMQGNYEIHQKLTDEKHAAIGTWDITPLCEAPERVRAVGTVYWEGRPVSAPTGGAGQMPCRRKLDRPTRAVRRTEDRAFHQHLPYVPAGLGADFLHMRQPWHLPASTI
jgi:hypothetical protein